MARDDIRPWRSPTGGEEILSFPVTAAQSFLRGEPVALIAAGTLSIAGSDPASIEGIAAHQATDRQGTALAVGSRVAVTGTPDTQVWRCDNFATDGSGTAATPTQANAQGELAGLVLNGSDWYVDTGAGNLLVVIDDVLDENGNIISDIRTLFGTATSVLFRFV